MALANELWVAKCQIERLETLLTKNNIIKNEIDAPPTDEEGQPARNAFQLFCCINGTQGKTSQKSRREKH